MYFNYDQTDKSGINYCATFFFVFCPFVCKNKKVGLLRMVRLFSSISKASSFSLVSQLMEELKQRSGINDRKKIESDNYRFRRLPVLHSKQYDLLVVPMNVNRG